MGARVQPRMYAHTKAWIHYICVCMYTHIYINIYTPCTAFSVESPTVAPRPLKLQAIFFFFFTL